MHFYLLPHLPCQIQSFIAMATVQMSDFPQGFNVHWVMQFTERGSILKESHLQTEEKPQEGKSCGR